MDDKIIVSNGAALAAKYKPSDVSRISKAIDALIAADEVRGIKSRLVLVDIPATMKSFGGKAVNDAASPRQNKDAIDAIFRTADPEYVMILGAPDVVPHQDLTNLVYDSINDPDQWALGDLPYACDAAYSRDIASFKGPTRVVGRLPDLMRASEPSYMLKLLSVARKHRSRAPKDYGAYFGLSTDSWRKSTSLSLDAILRQFHGAEGRTAQGPETSQGYLGSSRAFHQLSRRTNESEIPRREG